jgi:hypothetical protein
VVCAAGRDDGRVLLADSLATWARNAGVLDFASFLIRRGSKTRKSLRASRR